MKVFWIEDENEIFSSGEKQLHVDGVEVAPASGEKQIAWKDPGVWLFTVQTIYCQKPSTKQTTSGYFGRSSKFDSTDGGFGSTMS